MKIFTISDIHGEKKYFDAAEHLITGADLVVVAGDLTKTGRRESAEEVLSCIEELNTNILAVHGNWDRTEVLDLLEQKGYSIHGRGKIIRRIGFFGVGGSGKTPMRMTSEYTEEVIRGHLIAGYSEIRNAERVVLISHSPPKKVRDSTLFGISAGSTSISEFIQKNTINLCITGHIHEAYGTEYLNHCLVVNSGAFNKGRYASIVISDTVTAELGTLA